MKEEFTVKYDPQYLKRKVIECLDNMHIEGEEIFKELNSMLDSGEVDKKTFKIVGYFLVDKIIERK